MKEWISVKDRLLDLIEQPDGSVNCVLVYWKRESLDSCHPQEDVSNVAFFLKNLDAFSHWMPLPEPPDA